VSAREAVPPAARHTPGPWTAVNDTLVRGPHGEAIASTVGFAFPSCAYHMANANLIASAPDLKDVCIALIESAEWWRDNDDLLPMFAINRFMENAKLARAALAKAEGGGK
jgi:hypothetical protein